MKITNKTQNIFKGVLFFMIAILFISIVDTICKLYTKIFMRFRLYGDISLALTLHFGFFLFKGEKLSKLKVTNRPIIQIIRPGF